MERGRSRGPQHRTIAALADAHVLDGPARAQLIELARDGRLEGHWTRPAAPCELPRSVDDFTGRAAELAWLSELAPADNSQGVAGVGLITGSAGLGKTTFAVRAAHSMRPSFPDGVFFLDLFGMSQRPLAVDDALGLLLGALGVADQQIPRDTPGRAALYRSLLQDRRALVVLDNAASEEQVRPLLPGGGAGRALITSRRLLAGLEGVRRLILGPLPLPEARRLLTRIAGERPARDEEPAVTRLAELCGGLPLALRILGSRLASRPGWDAAELAARLADEERRLDQFKAGDLKVASAIGMSYEQLPESARRVFRRLAVVPGRDFDAALAAVAGAMPVGEALDALGDLVDLGLLQDSAAGRYRFHDLVRLFARERLQEETLPERAALTTGVTSWLLRMASMAGRWFEPGHARPGQPDPALAVLSSAAEAERWLRGNVGNWLGALQAAASCGEHSLVLDCAESMHWFSGLWVHGPHWREVFTLGVEAATALGDRAQRATQLNYLAWVHSVPPSDPQAMLWHATRALDLASGSDATVQLAWSHQYIALALGILGRFDEAAASAFSASEMFETMGDIDGYLQSAGLYGEYLREQGRSTEALEQSLRVLDLLDDEDSGMTRSIAGNVRPYALIRFGRCLADLGRRTEAVDTLTEAINLMEKLQLSNFRQADALETVAALLAGEDRADDSRQAYARAAKVYEATGDAAASSRCKARASAAP
jgi:tetratricopeptide (TPR) repeat protein